jgi:ABC-type uncharacterized transport system auxiliary subunit
MKTFALAFLTGCVLTSKTPALEIRYFSPPEQAAAPGSIEQPIEVRLGRVTASSHLRYRIAHRESRVELELYETLRWAERPDDYVRRALDRALFDEGGFTRAATGPAAEIEVEVTAFEEVHRAGRTFGRVELRFHLATENCVLAAETIAVEREATGSDIAGSVAAIGDALSIAASDVAARSRRALVQSLRGARENAPTLR